MEQDQRHEHKQDETYAGSMTPDPAPSMTSVVPPYELPRQSGLGIAAFIIGMVSVAALIVSFVTAAASIADFVSPDGTIDQGMMENEAMGPIMVAGLFILLSLGLSFIGLILGIIGVFMKNRRKVFSIIGLVLNGLVVFGFAALFIFGLAMQGMV